MSIIVRVVQTEDGLRAQIIEQPPAIAYGLVPVTKDDIITDHLEVGNYKDFAMQGQGADKILALIYKDLTGQEVPGGQQQASDTPAPSDPR